MLALLVKYALRRCNGIICCYNLCIVSSTLSYEVSMFYDTCAIWDPLQSFNRFFKSAGQDANTCCGTSSTDWYRSMYVSSVDELLLHFHPACARLCFYKLTVATIIIIIDRTICIDSYCDSTVLLHGYTVILRSDVVDNLSRLIAVDRYDILMHVEY